MSRVLVIDDHEPSRAHLVTILRECGYEIAGEGSSGKLALMLARRAAPEVISMAVGLADLDGIERAAVNAQRVLGGGPETGPEVFYREEETDIGM
jgi:DNA-binding NarL/FixJ family response regulator